MSTTKIYLEGSEFIGLSRHLSDEGDVLVPSENQAELSIIQPTRTIPGMILSELGYPLVALDNEEPTHTLTRFWDVKRGEFFNQLILGLPILGLMNENLGPQVLVGLITKFLNPFPLGEILGYEGIKDILRTWKYSGFVFATMCGDKVHTIQLGLPYGGIFNVCEYVRGKLSEWWKEPKELREEWAVSTLVSRSPFPYVSNGSVEEATVENLTKNIEKHFWLLEHRVIRGTVYSTSSRVGFASAWGRDLEDASFRCLMTCRNLRIPAKQHRTDLVDEAMRKLSQLRALGVLG
jgi:hypothetical protein